MTKSFGAVMSGLVILNKYEVTLSVGWGEYLTAVPVREVSEEDAAALEELGWELKEDGDHWGWS